MFKKIIYVFAVLSIIATNTLVYAEPDVSEETTQTENTESGLNITAETAVLIDPQTGIVLYEKDADKEMYPASITKIMTSLLAIEYAASEGHNFDEIVTHSHNAVYNIGRGSSHIGMRENEQITLNDALHGILLASANEVCMAVAEHIDGSVDNFVERMNRRAKELGAKHTHFANPHGFHDNNHYTSAHDIALIMAEAVKHPEFVNYISTYQYQIGFTNIVQEIRYLHNTNKLINPYSKYYWESCIGGKTGFTDEAGNTLVVYGGTGEHKLIAAVMKEPGALYSYTDTKALLEYGSSLYSGNKTTVISENEKLKDIDIMHNGEKVGTAEITAVEKYDVELPNNIGTDDVRIDITAPENFEVPVGVGKNAGKVYVLFNDRLLCDIDLTVTDVKDIKGSSVDYMDIYAEKETVSNNNVMNIIIISGCSVLGIMLLLIIFYIVNNIVAKKRQEKRLELKALERRERRRANLEKKLKQAESKKEE